MVTIFLIRQFLVLALVFLIFAWTGTNSHLLLAFFHFIHPLNEWLEYTLDKQYLQLLPNRQLHLQYRPEIRVKHHLSLVLDDHILLLARQSNDLHYFIDILKDKPAQSVFTGARRSIRVLAEFEEDLIHEFKAKSDGFEVFLVFFLLFEIGHHRLLVLVQFYGLAHF